MAPNAGGTFVPGAMPAPSSLETEMAPNGSLSGLSGGTFVPGAMPSPSSLQTQDSPNGSLEGQPQAQVENDPTQHVSRSVMAALSGGSGHPMDWARAMISGVLAGGANVGKAPEGAGFLYGLSKGAQGSQELARQKALDQQRLQQQQFENQEKLKADTRAEKELEIHTQDSTAQRAMWNAQTLASTQTRQQNAARFDDLQKEDKLRVRQLEDSIRESEQDQLSVLQAAGVDVTQLDHITGYDQITDSHAKQAGAGGIFAVPNGEEHKAGEDNAGAYMVPGDVWDRKIDKPITITSGYTLDKNGNAVPKQITAAAGTPVGTLLAIAKGAQKDLQTKQDQIYKAAQLQHEQAGTQSEKANAFKATEEGELTKSQNQILGAGGGTGTAAPANVDPRTGADEGFLSSLAPAVASEVRAIGEGRVEVNSRMFQSKQGQTLAAALTRAYPGFDQSKAQSYFKMRQDFTSGKTAQAINSYNTGIAHLGTMYDHVANASTVDINNPWSAVHRQLELDKQLVSTELAKAVSNGSMTEGEKNGIMQSISGATPNSYRTRIREAVELLHGKQEAYQQQWNNGAPPGAVSQVPIISPQADQTIAKINGQQQPQQQQPQGHPHPVGEVREYMGGKYVFDGKQYVLQQGGGEK